MIPRPKSRAPLIGITADLSSRDSRPSKLHKEATLFLSQRYCRAVEVAGGLPLLLPPILSKASAKRLLQRLDGLLISGGNFDIHPSYYGEKPVPALGELKPERTEFELELVNVALARDLPLLGICGGAQAINVALGGSLYQDIATQFPNPAKHQMSHKKTTGGHAISINPGTRLHRILRRTRLEVNTTHHQAVKRPGRGLIVNATAGDGVIEGIESSRQSFVLGVQWHPERYEAMAPDTDPNVRLFHAFQAMIVHIGLMRTSYGSILRGAGGNPKAIDRAGWSLLKTKVTMFALAGVFGMLAGMSLIGLTTSADANIALRYTLLSIAGVILGGGEFTGGRISPIGAVIGALTLTLAGSFLTFLRLSPDWQIGAQGAILILVLAIRLLLSRREARR
jgi:gamma-glutamyl-gamma-aminobutyrate hydrolase PuuD